MDCLFCKIVGKELPAEVVIEDQDFIVFKDIHPKAETHLLIIPKRHIDSVDTIKDDEAGLIGRLVITAQKLAQKLNLKSRYKLVFNVGRDGGQLIDHIHLHFLSGKQIDLP
jgi:histidine triad (HIT) family protein